MLITTSRKTSNRVRSFTRDLWSVFPNSERFNRGGMSRAELIARLINQNASYALIITMYKGNPNNLEILSTEGKTIATILMESAMLRREVSQTHNPRINNIHAVCVRPDSTTQTKELAQLIGSLLKKDVIESEEVIQDAAKSSAIIWFQDLDRGKTLWTHYHAFNGIEIGPRIRVSSISRSVEN